MVSTDYQRGYEAAYAERYAAVDSEDHPANCGECRACGVMRTVLEDSMRRLGGKMTPEEFDAPAGQPNRLVEAGVAPHGRGRDGS